MNAIPKAWRFAVATMLAMSTFASAVALSIAGEGPTVEVDSAEAARIAEDAVGLDAVEVSLIGGPHGLMQQVVGVDSRVAFIDAESGHVRGLVGSLAAPSGALESELTTEGALQVAVAAVAPMNPRINGMRLMSATRVMQSIEFYWCSVDANGAQLPDWAIVGVDLTTGEVGAYASGQEDVRIDTRPTVGEAEARRLVESGLPAELKAAEHEFGLKVLTDLSGNQRLVWHAVYSTQTSDCLPYSGDEVVMYGSLSRYLDAKSGEDVTQFFE